MAPYFWDCLRFATDQIPDLQVDVIAHDPSENAPLKFSSEPRLSIQSRSNHDQNSMEQWLVERGEPELLLITGWTDKDYLRVAEQAKCPTVCMVDNPYRGTLRQRLAGLVSRFHLKKRFDYLWVPGRPQYELARRLGFEPAQIQTDLYCANESTFKTRNHSNSNKRKRLLFVGRLLPWKGIEDLVEAFISACKPNEQSWELAVCGTGPLASWLQKIDHPKINYLGFVPPETLPAMFQDSDAFCLPSWNEHWGVVVHEAALSGLPIIASDKVCAATDFVIDRFNGRLFEAKRRDQLQQSLEWIFGQNEESLQQMSQRSAKLGSRLDRQIWTAKLTSFVA